MSSIDLHKIELEIDELNLDGDGVARLEGKVYFVPWAIPGDFVSVEVIEEFNNFSKARLVSILKNSSSRINPVCRYFFECGGCQLQNADYQAQLVWKQSLVQHALKKIPGLSGFVVEPVRASPQIWNYRNRIQLHRSKDGKVGFFKPQSHEVIEIDECSIADKALNQKLKNKAALPIEKDRLELRLDGESAFGQVNSLQNENLKTLVLELASPTKKDVVFDLYAGSGNLTLELAKKANMVYAVERVDVACAAGAEKAKVNKIENILWTCGPVAKHLLAFNKQKLSADTIVVDPPREGLMEVTRFLQTAKFKKLVYVSCNPATFARDAGELLADGKAKLKRVIPLDMFPHTSHVELVGLFERL